MKDDRQTSLDDIHPGVAAIRVTRMPAIGKRDRQEWVALCPRHRQLSGRLISFTANGG
jgi:hypothetical protein